MTAQMLFLGLMLLQSIVLCAVFIALFDLARVWCRLDGLLAFCAAVLALGVIGYLAFWLAYVSFPVFHIVKIAVLAALVIHCGAVIYRRRLSGWLGEPLLFTFLFFVAVVALGFSNGGIADPATTAQNRFSHPLPPDNILPFIFAIAVNIGHVPSPLVGDWLASDRPPLQTGLYLLLGLRNSPLVYQLVASWLQATFLFGVWAFAMAADLPAAARRLVLLACCLLPPTILNTFYTWPKIVSVGDLMIVFALLFCYRPSDDRERKAAGVLLGGFAALAMLSHGSSAFALIGIAAMVLAAWQWLSWKTVIPAAASAVLLYAPWIAYQAFIDPPGNRLLKWHLAGIMQVDGRGLVETVRASYGALSWQEYLDGRLANVHAIVGPWPSYLRDLAGFIASPDANAAMAFRQVDFFNLLPSLHMFSVALIAALGLLPFMGGERSRQRRIALCLFGAALITCIVYAALLFIPGSAVNHQGTYAVHVMATVSAFMVLSLRARPLALLFIGLQTVTVVALYVVAVPHDPGFWPTQMVCAAAAIALFGYALAPAFAAWRGRVEPVTE